MSNQRVVNVPREFVSPSIEGVDFGGRCWVIARSPLMVLVWVYGHSWSVNGNQRYSGPKMILFTDRRRSDVHRFYRYLAEDVRLSRAVMSGVLESGKLDRLVDGDFEIESALVKAVVSRETVLIEGGGYPLMPCRLGGEGAYRAWRSLPDRGFLMPDLIR